MKGALDCFFYSLTSFFVGRFCFDRTAMPRKILLGNGFENWTIVSLQGWTWVMILKIARIARVCQ